MTPRAPAPAAGPAAGLRAPLTTLRGVGPVRAERLERLGLECVRDLLLCVPRRLEPVGPLVDMASAREMIGQPVTVRGAAGAVRFVRGRGRRSVLRARFTDETGALDALFFNQPWMREQLATHASYELQGRVAETRSGPALTAPRVAGREADGPGGRALPAPGSLLVHYPLTEGLGQGFVRDLVASVLEPWAGELIERVPPAELESHGLPSLAEAVRAMHAPEDTAGFLRARRRVTLEALLELAERLADRRAGRAGKARAFRVDAPERRQLAELLPFALTPSQRKATGEVLADLARGVPMRRLLHGDVGSGKTAVAAVALLAVARAGGAAALLAPTELLAEQHAASLAPLWAAGGVTAELVTGSLSGRERRARGSRLASGEARVVIGTHALLAENVEFAGGLDLAVIDEQQRFGVAQRARLLEKGRDAHALLTTATPIPRTLALALYGDLDVSELTAPPEGRGGRRTRIIGAADRRRLLGFIDKRLALGERAFWVAPRISGEEGAEAAAERLAATPLARHGIELVHGRVRADHRGARLARFRSGESRLLVGTTVIEVGVDVPEATVMVVDGAERLGLAQLHQLRGRVGRGPQPGHCLLVVAPSARERLAVLAETEDGFRVAEEDLRRRGMGDLAGLRQAGAAGEFLDVRGAAEWDASDDLDLLLLARRIVGAELAPVPAAIDRSAD